MSEAATTSERRGFKRQYSGKPGKVFRGVIILFTVYLLLYISGTFGYAGLFIYPVNHISLTIGFVLSLVYLFYPATKGAPRDRLPWYDALAVLLLILVNGYIFLYNVAIIERPYILPTTAEQVFSVIMVVLILEAVRRTTGPVLAILGLLFFIYPFFAGSLPGLLYSRSQGLARVAEQVYVFPVGIYGSLPRLFSTLICALLLFGAILQGSGADRFLTSVALGSMGRYRGGPAKVAVVASALFGTISGSSIANAAMTGPVTIPLMKRIGYQPHYAAAVEAVASNGGQIMPPVLGIAAFLMMDFLGVGYATVMMAALIPALLYYFALFFMLDLEAAKTGIYGLSREGLPSVRKVLREGWLYLLPVALLVVLITVLHFSPETSAIYSLVAVVLVSWFIKGQGMGPARIADSLVRGVQEMPQLCSVVTMIAILVGSIELTGVGVRLAGGLVTLAGGNLFLLLLFTAIVSMFLGMGLPTAAVYMIVAILMAPALVMVGIPPIVAHFFVFYYGLTAMLTPPVCLVVFVTAAIAGSPIMKTGWQSMRLGIVVFIVPFMFVYSPELLMIGSADRIVIATVVATIGVVLLSTGLEAYLLKRMSRLEQMIFLAAGAITIIPGLTTAIIGTAAGAALIVWQFMTRKAGNGPLAVESPKTGGP